jgi:hypothetical protein
MMTATPGAAARALRFFLGEAAGLTGEGGLFIRCDEVKRARAARHCVALRHWLQRAEA